MRANNSVINKSNGTIRGDNNVVNGSNNEIYGHRNVVNGSNNEIEGNSNKINGSNGDIVGNNNIISGSNNDVKGNNNNITGSNNDVVGNNNIVKGSNNDVKGSNNDVKGTNNTVNGSNITSTRSNTGNHNTGLVFSSGLNNFGNFFSTGSTIINGGSVIRCNGTFATTSMNIRIGSKSITLRNAKMTNCEQSNRGFSCNYKNSQIFTTEKGVYYDDNFVSEDVFTRNTYEWKDFIEILKKSQTVLKLEGEDENTDVENDLCCVCLQNKKKVVLLNCAHICTCIECSNAIIEKKSGCPICRKSIDDARVVYQ